MVAALLALVAVGQPKIIFEHATHRGVMGVIGTTWLPNLDPLDSMFAESSTQYRGSELILLANCDLLHGFTIKHCQPNKEYTIKLLYNDQLIKQVNIEPENSSFTLPDDWVVPVALLTQTEHAFTPRITISGDRASDVICECWQIFLCTPARRLYFHTIFDMYDNGTLLPTARTDYARPSTTGDELVRIVQGQPITVTGTNQSLVTVTSRSIPCITVNLPFNGLLVGFRVTASSPLKSITLRLNSYPYEPYYWDQPNLYEYYVPVGSGQFAQSSISLDRIDTACVEVQVQEPSDAIITVIPSLAEQIYDPSSITHHP